MNYGYTFCRGLNATVKGHYRTGQWNFSLLSSLTWQRDADRTDPDDEDMYDKPICYSPTVSTGVTEFFPHQGEKTRSVTLIDYGAKANIERELQRRGCDIGRSTYEKYEVGELNIRVSVLIELKKIYGCSYDDFFEGLDG